MARHGENIRKRKDGRWEGRYKIYHDEKGIYIYRSVYGRSYEEVKEKLATQKNLQKTPSKEIGTEVQDAAADKLFFCDVATEWLAGIKSQKKPSTYEKYSMVYKKYLEEVFRGAMLSDLTDTYVREKISDPLSDSVMKSVYCVLNQVLKFASLRYCAAMPELQKPASGIRNKPVAVLTRAELGKLFSVLYKETDLFKMAVLVCLYTGLRLGEICALKWSDIDFGNKVITVNRTVQRLYVEGGGMKTALVETEPKSECSRREIPISAAVMELLVMFRSDRDYVFGGDKPMDPRKMQYHFKKILGEAGLEDKNFHILRHTFATCCVEGKMDVKSLSEILGHANVQITLNRYVHPSMETKRGYMEAVPANYGQNCGQAG